MTAYDRIGATYAQARRTDPRIATSIAAALGDAGSVVNVGAGTGSYEPQTTVLAVEPSRTMIRQRPPGSAPVVQGVAEALPLVTRSVDAALAVLTVHHWVDVEAGIAELCRVARRRVVVLTWVPEVFATFWLLRDYLPALLAADARIAVPLDRLRRALGPDRVTVRPVPVPADCVDGFAAAYWRRPEAYLDPVVRSGISLLAAAPPEQLHDGLARLADDVRTGRWHVERADLLASDELDLGYCTVTAELAF
jgi:SAM-dependent methyltransferase